MQESYFACIYLRMKTETNQTIACYHCGEDCITNDILFNEKHFCCHGCKTVYQILKQSDLCEYYSFNQTPGVHQRTTVRKDKFAFLDDLSIQQKLISFQNQTETHVTFYTPHMHCSSCLWLLENLHKLEAPVISSRVNFPKKEVTIIFNHSHVSLRKIAELLTEVGYEPYISLQNLNEAKPQISRSLIYKLGVAGFCFSNIMLMSFPEYLGLEAGEKSIQTVFRYLNLLLALPVLLYSSIPFYKNAWAGIRNKFLNIDAPIALAIIVTFGRSMYEVLSQTGGGYFDSMSGIVFFMLIGRILQEKTYQQLSFDRDYTSYFPIAISVVKDEKEIPTPVPDVKVGNTIRIHHEELIPADGLLTRGKALIDYSFVTGESIPVQKEMGELIYAGGKQKGGAIELLVMKEVSQSYLTKLWNKDAEESPQRKSFVHALGKYFTLIVFMISFGAAAYWFFHEPAKAWNVLTTVLIVACPCALLLSNSFTNGNILRIFSRNKLFLRNAQAIEDMAAINHIVFDKTGTLTSTQDQDLDFIGEKLSVDEMNCIAALASQSNHPLSKLIAKQAGKPANLFMEDIIEIPGKGIMGMVNSNRIRIGSHNFIVGGTAPEAISSVYVAVNGKQKGYFKIKNHYRNEIFPLLRKLKNQYSISVLSGDNEAEKTNLENAIGKDATLLFNQQPVDKMNYIKQLQQNGNLVMMIGDGLNDAGALRQSNIGIAVTESTNNFTPASDAIAEVSVLTQLRKFIRMAKANKQIVMASFILSILYNVIGLYFAVQGVLSPLVAAILMPASSISIILITFGSSTVVSKIFRLK